MKNLFTLTLAAAVLAFSVPAFAQDSTIKSAEIYRYAGVPTSGTSEIQTVTIGGTPTGGTFTITTASGRTTAAITWSATNATLVSNIDTALERLNVVGTSGVTTAVGTMTAGVGTITLTFTGKNAKMDFPTLTATSSLTGTSPTVAITTTTPGVAATFREALPGTLLVDTVTPDLYINDGTVQYNPTWTKVSP
jgi:hypothetical protein